MRTVFFIGYICICAIVKVIAYEAHTEAEFVVAAVEFVVFTFYKTIQHDNRPFATGLYGIPTVQLAFAAHIELVEAYNTCLL